jgi:hypothetical protein
MVDRRRPTPKPIKTWMEGGTSVMEFATSDDAFNAGMNLGEEGLVARTRPSKRRIVEVARVVNGVPVW